MRDPRDLVFVARVGSRRRGTGEVRSKSRELQVMHQTYTRQQTVRAPLTRNDLENSDYDTVFLVVELSDAIRRGVYYFSIGGEPLPSLNEVLNALVVDGEVAYDDDEAEDPVPH